MTAIGRSSRLVRRLFGILLPALAVISAAAALPASAQVTDPPMTPGITTDVQSGMVMSSTGLQAVVPGRRVILEQDGSWRHLRTDNLDQAVALTDTGQMVELTIDPNADGTHRRTWRYLATGAGPLHVAVTRAVATDKSLHSNRDNCIPVVTLRNLTKVRLFRIIIEIEFRDTNGKRGGTSLMAGPLEDGEQQEIVSAPLFLPGCDSLVGELHVPYCTFRDGTDCAHLVAASAIGSVPLTLSRSTEDSAVGQAIEGARQQAAPPNKAN